MNLQRNTREWLLVSCLALVPSAAGQTRTLQGCLDGKPGPQYVLRGDRELRLIAELLPAGFPTTSFAKYLGHRVEVTRRVTGELPRRVSKSRCTMMQDNPLALTNSTYRRDGAFTCDSSVCDGIVKLEKAIDMWD
ncbi:MAG: hypothetical protein ABI806_05625 [Candidatus Solibacter sp.]